MPTSCCLFVGTTNRFGPTECMRQFQQEALYIIIMYYVLIVLAISFYEIRHDHNILPKVGLTNEY